MSLCRDMMPPWEIKAEMDRLTTENERLGRDYQTARDAHDKLLLKNDRLRAALERIAFGKYHWEADAQEEARAALEDRPKEPAMIEGGIILSCGCRYQPSMGDVCDLLRTWVDEICTRDFDNPFVTAEITGTYCDECWKKMKEASDE